MRWGSKKNLQQADVALYQYPHLCIISSSLVTKKRERKITPDKNYANYNDILWLWWTFANRSSTKPILFSANPKDYIKFKLVGSMCSRNKPIFVHHVISSFFSFQKNVHWQWKNLFSILKIVAPIFCRFFTTFSEQCL